MLGWPSDLIPTLLLNDLVEFTINLNLVSPQSGYTRSFTCSNNISDDFHLLITASTRSSSSCNQYEFDRIEALQPLLPKSLLIGADRAVANPIARQSGWRSGDLPFAATAAGLPFEVRRGAFFCGFVLPRPARFVCGKEQLPPIESQWANTVLTHYRTFCGCCHASKSSHLSTPMIPDFKACYHF